MRRRDFLTMTACASAALGLARVPAVAAVVAAPAHDRHVAGGYRNLLILVELAGGNDGLNTVIPYSDPAYPVLRPRIAIRREQVVPLDERSGLHPALAPLMPLWRSGELAIVQGVGYAQPNLSHYRSIEIWDTASPADRYLREGWLTRAFAQRAVPREFAADGAVIGTAEEGPLAHGARVIALAGFASGREASGRLLRERRRVRWPGGAAGLAVSGAAASDERPGFVCAPPLRTVFPSGAFGTSLRTAMRWLAALDAAPRGSAQGVAVLRLTLNGFDTHRCQPDTHAALLGQLATGLASLRAGLVELGRWQRTLVMTCSEFGRRPGENGERGTEHGTVAPHFVLGGRVRGGLYGAPAVLTQLDGNGQLPVHVDFRQLHATVLDAWWALDATAVLGRRFAPLPLLRV
jgi:uncharacterized protein (DUF1501 family)